MRPLALPLTAALCALAVSCSSGSEESASSAIAEIEQVTDCVGDRDAAERQMTEYIQSPEGFDVRTDVADDGSIEAVMITIAPIELGDDGTSPTLPIVPCQRIYRWAMQDIPPGEGGIAGPFPYMELDWNTEGLTRGPNGAFVYPHFDFHFYTKPAEFIQSLSCVPLPPTDRVCDAFRTDYERMRAFQNMVPGEYLPDTYRADILSAIPEMGLHYLDSGFDFTVDSVNNTPVLLYGSYDGEIAFAEGAVTIFTLANVKAAPEQSLSWDFPQPQEYWAEIDWPTRFTITYLPETDQFEAGFTDFVRREP